MSGGAGLSPRRAPPAIANSSTSGGVENKLSLSGASLPAVPGPATPEGGLLVLRTTPPRGGSDDEIAPIRDRYRDRGPLRPAGAPHPPSGHPLPGGEGIHGSGRRLLASTLVVLLLGTHGLARTPDEPAKAAPPAPRLDGPLVPEKARGVVPTGARPAAGAGGRGTARRQPGGDGVRRARAAVRRRESRVSHGPGRGQAPGRPDRDARGHRRRRADGQADGVRRRAHLPQRRHALEGGADRHVRPGRAPPARHRRRRQGRRAAASSSPASRRPGARSCA